MIYIRLASLVMLVAAAGVYAADPSDVSPYDRNAACMERSEGGEPSYCTKDDGPPPPQYVRRYRQPVVNGPVTTDSRGAKSAGQPTAPPTPQTQTDQNIRR